MFAQSQPGTEIHARSSSVSKDGQKCPHDKVQCMIDEVYQCYNASHQLMSPVVRVVTIHQNLYHNNHNLYHDNYN